MALLLGVDIDTVRIVQMCAAVLKLRVKHSHTHYCLLSRLHTFKGFTTYSVFVQLVILVSSLSSDGEKEEGDESLDLRRTESDSVLKKVHYL